MCGIPLVKAVQSCVYAMYTVVHLHTLVSISVTPKNVSLLQCILEKFSCNQDEVHIISDNLKTVWSRGHSSVLPPLAKAINTLIFKIPSCSCYTLLPAFIHLFETFLEVVICTFMQRT